MKKEYILPLTFILIAIILGGSYFATAKMKYNAIEKENIFKENAMIECVKGAEAIYWNVVRLNGEEIEEGTYTADAWVWDDAQLSKDKAVNECKVIYK